MPVQNEDYLTTFKNTHCLITGGLGFIGSNLAHRLVELGAEVLLVDSLIPDYGGNLFNIRGIENRVQVNVADVRDPSSMAYLVQGQEYLFNLAGQISHIDSMHDPYTDLEINTRSQLSILEACRHYNPDIKIVYASTRQIYGIPDRLPVDERHIAHPTDVNGINKMAGEWYHIVYNNIYGIRACSLRLTNTYGPRLLVKHRRQGFIGWFLNLALHDQEIELYGGGDQKRDFTYVDDAVDAFLRAAANDESNGRVFNLGGPEPVSLRDFAALLIEICGRGRYRAIRFPPERKRIDIGDFYADWSKIERILGWQPAVSLREGLERTVTYYHEFGEHYW